MLHSWALIAVLLQVTVTSAAPTLPAVPLAWSFEATRCDGALIAHNEGALAAARLAAALRALHPALRKVSYNGASDENIGADLADLQLAVMLEVAPLTARLKAVNPAPRSADALIRIGESAVSIVIALREQRFSNYAAIKAAANELMASMDNTPAIGLIGSRDSLLILVVSEENQDALSMQSDLQALMGALSQTAHYLWLERLDHLRSRVWASSLKQEENTPERRYFDLLHDRLLLLRRLAMVRRADGLEPSRAVALQAMGILATSRTYNYEASRLAAKFRQDYGDALRSSAQMRVLGEAAMAASARVYRVTYADTAGTSVAATLEDWKDRRLIIITDNGGANGILIREYSHLHEHPDAATTEDVVRLMRAGDEISRHGEGAVITSIDVVNAVSREGEPSEPVGRVHLKGFRGVHWIDHRELGDLAPVGKLTALPRSVH